jgi:hypothetical protein
LLVMLQRHFHRQSFLCVSTNFLCAQRTQPGKHAQYGLGLCPSGKLLVVTGQANDKRPDCQNLGSLLSYREVILYSILSLGLIIKWPGKHCPIYWRNENLDARKLWLAPRQSSLSLKLNLLVSF